MPAINIDVDVCPVPSSAFPWFIGEVTPLFGLKSIVGMSRGPIFGFKNIPNGEWQCWVPRHDQGNDCDGIAHRLRTLVGCYSA